MSGRPKQGIDYAGWSVDIFDGDKKIDKLLDAKGWKGFADIVGYSKGRVSQIISETIKD